MNYIIDGARMESKMLPQTLVRPHMDQTKPISSINLIALFVIKECGNVFQGFCNSAPHASSFGSFLRVASTPTAVSIAGAIIQGKAVACFYFGQTFPSQYVADIDRARCNHNIYIIRYCNHTLPNPKTHIISSSNFFHRTLTICF